MALQVKNPSVMQEIQEIRVQSLGQKDPLKEDMATHCSILAWVIPLTDEPQGKPKNTGVGSLSLLQQIFLTQESNRGSCIAGGFFTN